MIFLDEARIESKEVRGFFACGIAWYTVAGAMFVSGTHLRFGVMASEL